MELVLAVLAGATAVAGGRWLWDRRTQHQEEVAELEGVRRLADEDLGGDLEVGEVGGVLEHPGELAQVLAHDLRLDADRPLHQLPLTKMQSDNDFRIEKDSLGEMRVPAGALYGAQTQRAAENFPISGIRFPRRFTPSDLLLAINAVLLHPEDLRDEAHDVVLDGPPQVLAGSVEGRRASGRRR